MKVSQFVRRLVVVFLLGVSIGAVAWATTRRSTPKSLAKPVKATCVPCGSQDVSSAKVSNLTLAYSNRLVAIDFDVSCTGKEGIPCALVLTTKLVRQKNGRWTGLKRENSLVGPSLGGSVSNYQRWFSCDKQYEAGEYGLLVSIHTGSLENQGTRLASDMTTFTIK